PVSLKVENLSVKAALARFLEELGLTHMVKDGSVVITTLPRGPGARDAACGEAGPRDHATLKQVLYSVADLIVPVVDDPAPSWARSLCPEVCHKERGAAHTCEEALLHYITRTVAPESWHDKGGPGTLHYFPLGMVLVVNQTPELQQEV